MSDKKCFADHPFFTSIVRLEEAKGALERAIQNLHDKMQFNAACDLRKVLKDIGEVIPDLTRRR